MTAAKGSSVIVNPRPVLMLMSSRHVGLARARSPDHQLHGQYSCPRLSREETLLTWLSSFSCRSFMVSSSKALLKKKHENKACKENILIKPCQSHLFHVSSPLGYLEPINSTLGKAQVSRCCPHWLQEDMPSLMPHIVHRGPEETEIPKG